MTRRISLPFWPGLLLGALIAFTFSPAAANVNEKSEAPSRLLTLVTAQFPNLTEAERALLVFIDLNDRTQGDFPLAGPSVATSDASNDPVHANQWNHGRDVRAELIRWLSVDPDASPLGDPRGIRLLGARVTGKILRESGDEPGATEVLIANDDLNYRRFGLSGRIWGAFLNTTIGYGYQPLHAIVWSFAVVIFGSMVVATGKRAGVMHFRWPVDTPPPPGDPTAGLHPMLYSLDVFVPFVNLHQENYWWPDETASGECAICGEKVPVRGSVLRYYLWLQIVAGWLLSAIFIAGVTGLVRSD